MRHSEVATGFPARLGCFATSMANQLERASPWPHRSFRGWLRDERDKCKPLDRRVKVVPRAGVEPARPFGQRILSPVIGPLPNLTKRYKPVFTRLAVVMVSAQ